MTAIDWLDPGAKASAHFTVGELIWLPQWKRLATEADGLDAHVKRQLVYFAAKMDAVRDFLKAPVIVHCWYRPPKYNQLVKGARYSAHQCLGPHAAVDFHVDGKADLIGCAATRARLLPMLDAWEMRMENNPGGAWVHLDSKQPVNGQPRFFVP